MNKRVFGVSFAAIFAVAMVASSAYAGGPPPSPYPICDELTSCDIEDGTVFDVGNMTKNSQNKNRAPAHWDIEATYVGDFESDAALIQVSSETAIGLGIAVPQEVDFDIFNGEQVWYAMTSHLGDDSDPENPLDFETHGHKVTTIEYSENCEEGDLEVIGLEDIGHADASYVGPNTTVTLGDIPSGETPVSYTDACDDSFEEDANIMALVVIYKGALISEEPEEYAVCLHPVDVASADSADGGINKHRPNGFTTSTAPVELVCSLSS